MSSAPHASATLEPTPAEAAWRALAAELADRLALLWPAMPQRLGERYGAFVEHALGQGEARGLRRFGAAARFANLCFVWGPSFHERAGFEWAHNLLNSAAAQDWATSHRLVQRSLRELERLPDRRIAPELLEHADAQVVERFGGFGRRGELPTAQRQVPALPAPRRPCDLEAAELRLLSRAVEQRYVLRAGGAWERETLPAPAPLRVTITQALPALVAVLSVGEHEPAPSRLQARAAFHAQCDDRVHPALNFDGPHGRWRWVGHETRAASWPLHTLPQPIQPGGAGTALAEETEPAMQRLQLDTCGLRDEAEPLGALETQVWVWPAAQWWLQWERRGPGAPSDGPALVPAAAPMRAQVERDGVAQDTSALRQGFEQGLDSAVAAAWSRLVQAWTQGAALAPGDPAGGPGGATPASSAAAAAPPIWPAPATLGMASAEGLLAFLVGRAAATWGWQLGPGGMAERPFMRCIAALDLEATKVDVRLEAELARAGASFRVRLHVAGATALQAHCRAEERAVAPRAAVAAARATLHLPWRAEVVALAGASGVLVGVAGACRGALIAEAGLRPRSTGGTGLEWFASLRTEPVVLPLRSVDPLGLVCEFDQPLLPALSLLDWSGP